MFVNETDNVQPPPQGEAIFEASAQDFEEKVLKASFEKPVIAYFTAPWCSPCKQLGPVLENAVTATNGEIVMGKVDLDSNQDLAAALRIQSVPTIFAFFQGQPVDAFQGAVPESHVKEFIHKLVQVARSAKPEAIDISEVMAQGQAALADGEFGLAQGLFMQILQQDENHGAAYAGLIRTFIGAGELEPAAEMVRNASDQIAKDTAFQEAKTALELAQNPPSGQAAELEDKLSKNENDHQVRYDLALELFSMNRKEEALEHLLEIIARERAWNEEGARLQLLKYFEALGAADPLTIQARKKLSSLIFS